MTTGGTTLGGAAVGSTTQQSTTSATQTQGPVKEQVLSEAVDADDIRAVYPLDGVRVDPGSPHEDVFTGLLSTLETFDTSVCAVLNEKFIETASGQHLERLGEPVGIERVTGESDDSLRRRIAAAYLIARSTCDFESVAQAALVLLDADRDQIKLNGPPDTDGGVGEIEVPDPLVDDSPLTRNQIEEELSKAVPFGHRITLITNDVWRLGRSGSEGLGKGGLIT